MINLNRAVLCIFILGGIYLGVLTFPNHYLFKTYSLDHGLYESAVYQYSIGRFGEANRCYQLLELNSLPILAVHFEPILVLLVPFQYVFGTYGLVLAQWLSVLTGALGFARWLSLLLPNQSWAHALGLAFWLFNWGVNSALATDFHTNVLGVAFIPWAVWAVEKRRFWTAGSLLLLACCCKENVPFVLSGLLGSLALAYRHNRQQALFYLLSAIGCFFFFVLTITYFIPAASNFEYSFAQADRYQVLGDSIWEIALAPILKPVTVLRLLFSSPDSNTWFDPIKLETYTVVLFSAGILIPLCWELLPATLPIIFQKFLSDDAVRWGINGQYSIEWVPVLAVVLALALKRISESPFRVLALPVGLGVVLSTIAISQIKNFNRTSIWFDAGKYNVWSSSHYRSSMPVEPFYEAMRIIPTDEPVSAHNFLQPHLALRKRALTFPRVEEAQWILLHEAEACYPISQEEVVKAVAEYRKNAQWEIYRHEPPMILFRRKN